MSVMDSLMKFPPLFALLVCGLSACNGSGSRTQVNIATVDSDWFNAPLTEAVSRASEAPDFRVRTLDVASGLASKTALLSGNVDVGLAAPTPLLRDPEARQRVRILGCYMRSDRVLGVATRDEAALLVPPVGIVEGTISEIYFRLLMRRQAPTSNQKITQPRTLAMRPPDGIPNLENGQIGSAVLWEPHLTRADGLDRVVAVRVPSIYEVNVCLITTHDAYQRKRQAIDAFTLSVRRASESIRANPEAARRRTEERLDYDPGFLSNSWQVVDFGFRDNPADILRVLSTESRVLQEIGLLAAPATQHELTRMASPKG